MLIPLTCLLQQFTMRISGIKVSLLQMLVAITVILRWAPKLFSIPDRSLTSNCSRTRGSQQCDAILAALAEVQEKQPSNMEEIGTDHQLWITQFVGSGLEMIQLRINKKIRQNVKKLKKHKTRCKNTDAGGNDPLGSLQNQQLQG
jgi:hypothetical protein